MLLHYLKTSFRSIKHYKYYFATNTLGMVIGIFVFTALLLYVTSQLSYNSFHSNYRRIARLTTQINSADNFTHFAVAAKPVAPLLAKQFPEIENYVRLAEIESSIHIGSSVFEAQQVLFADSSFLSIFSFPIQGHDKENLMVNPNAVLLSPLAAQKFFGEQNPVGKIFTMLTPKDTFALTVAGIIEQAPTHSTIEFEVVANFSLIEKNYGDNPGALASFSTYLLCHNKEAIATLNHNLAASKNSYLPPELARSMTHYAQPFEGVYFSRDLNFDFGKKGNRTYVYTVAALAVTILVMAIFNYLNLSAALLLKRHKQFTIHRILGSGNNGLLGQIFIESFALTSIATMLALLLVFAFSNWSDDFSLLPIAENFMQVSMLSLGLLLLIPLTICLFLFSYNLSNSSISMSSRIKPLKKGYVLRKGLVLVQFAFSIVFIIASLIISRQMSYVIQKEIGYIKENMVLISLPRNSTPERAKALKNELLSVAGIQGVSNSGFGIYGMMGQKHVTLKHKGKSQGFITNYNAVDYHFLTTFKLKLLAGRAFDQQFGSESSQSLLINEAALALLGFSDAEEALNSTLQLNEEAPRKVIGIIANYHYASLHEKIEPLILVIDPLETPRQVAIHVGAGNMDLVKPQLEKIWHSFHPNLPFEYTYLQDMIASDYKSEESLGTFFKYAAFILILLSCIGLISVTTFTLEQKEKEISIRKVLGASLKGLVLSINREFLPLVLFANLLAWPMAYFAAKQWLDAFVYRIEPEWYYFTLAGIIGLLLALVVVSYLGAKACLKNPITVLRGE